MTAQPPDAPDAPAVPHCYRHPDRETWISCQRCGRPICPDCMHSASVGFQCPECIREGRKTTRAPRTLGGGLLPSRSGIVTKILIGLNVLGYIAVLATQTDVDGWSQVEDKGVLLPVGTTFSDVGHVGGVADGEYWRLLTAAFLHASILHILFNMYALAVFGPMLEQALGYVRFLALYLTTAIASSVTVYWLSPEHQVTVGASGAIFGLFGASFAVLRKRGLDLSPLFMLLAINLFITFAVPNISWQGHIGGLVCGLVLGGVVAYAPREHRNLVQGVAFGVVWLALIVLIVARTNVLS
ncbi:MAG TPA: rhomboid family intramembrane serine protease [Nocardioidaceae bacterium]|nr:rhomboid family intramembrane serine protease [Nocardioidaceae bacterium]